MSKTAKIGITCFTGAFVGVITAALLMSSSWWLGLTIGAAVGFIVGWTWFDFRQVVTNIPLALRRARKECQAFFASMRKAYEYATNAFQARLKKLEIMFTNIAESLARSWNRFELRQVVANIPSAFRLAWHGGWGIVRRTYKNENEVFHIWLKKPHFFFYLWAILSLLWFITEAYSFLADSSISIWDRQLMFGVVFLVYSGMYYACVLICGLAFAALGSNKEELLYLEYYFAPGLDREQHAEVLANLREAGLPELERPYLFLYRRWLVATGKTLFFLFYQMPRYLFLFSRHLIRLVHSKERLLCGVDSALGMVIAYTYWMNPWQTWPETITVAAYGGIIGAVIGMFNYEIVSKRLLRVIPIKA